MLCTIAKLEFQGEQWVFTYRPHALYKHSGQVRYSHYAEDFSHFIYHLSSPPSLPLREPKAAVLTVDEVIFEKEGAKADVLCSI